MSGIRFLPDSSVLPSYLASARRDDTAMAIILKAARRSDVSVSWSDDVEREIRPALLGRPALARHFSPEETDAVLALPSAGLERIPSLLGPVERECRDPGDDVIIATAVAAGCDRVVTLDLDVPSLGRHRGIQFVKRGAALELLGEAGLLTES